MIGKQQHAYYTCGFSVLGHMQANLMALCLVQISRKCNAKLIKKFVFFSIKQSAKHEKETDTLNGRVGLNKMLLYS